jgi:S1-C subfamily serine protease
MLLSLAALLIGQGCASQRDVGRSNSGGGYDYNTLRVSDRAVIFSKGYGSYLLHCEGSFVDAEGMTFKFHLRGIVSPLEIRGKTYFLAAGHVFDLAAEVSKRGASLAGAKLAPPAYYIQTDAGRLELERVDRGTRDLALFVSRGSREYFPPIRYKVGDSDDLRPGIPVLSWGLPLLEDFELSIGIVSALEAPRSLLQASFPEGAAEDFFVTSMPTIFGCSGALVYAFRDGNPEIVGMVVAGYININRSIVYKINSILRDSGLGK